MEVEVIGRERLTDKEIEAYKKYIQEKHPDIKITKIVLKAEGEFMNIISFCDPPPFERIRRITGYLVGTLDRFNDAKRAEEADRVKHDACEPEQAEPDMEMG